MYQIPDIKSTLHGTLKQVLIGLSNVLKRELTWETNLIPDVLFWSIISFPTFHRVVAMVTLNHPWKAAPFS